MICAGYADKVGSALISGKLRDCLRDQKAVKRVFVMEGQLAQPIDVLRFDRQESKAIDPLLCLNQFG